MQACGTGCTANLLTARRRRACIGETRLSTAVGLAQGVEYLHHNCVSVIIHGDIKSSNVLLDSNLEAHLGDFGLAKALVENYDSVNTESNSWLAGSSDYFSLEYAYSMKATKKSDVCSLGIVLMEIVSGKMPIEGMFGVNMEEHGSVREELIDPRLKPLLPGEESTAYQVLEIALQCTKTNQKRGRRPGKPVISSSIYSTIN